MAVSLYMSGSQIQVLVGSGAKRSVKVKNVYRYPVSEGAMLNGIITNDALMKEDLEKCWEQFKLPKKNVQLVIDSGKILTKTMEIPYMKDSELLKVIAMEFEDSERESQMFDYFPLPKKGPYEMNSVFCVGLEKEMMESYLELMKSLKIQVKGINTGFAAFLKLSIQTGMFAEQTCVLMLKDGENVMSVLFENGTYLYLQRNRLFNDEGTPERMDELVQIISGIQQFQVARKNTYSIDRIYTSGFEGVNRVEFQERVSMFAMNLQTLDRIPGVTFPVMGQSDKGEVRIEAADYLFGIGSLIG